jgi:hypothetical protein
MLEKVYYMSVAENVDGDVADMGERRDAYRVSWGNVRERDHLEDPGIDGRIY